MCRAVVSGAFVVSTVLAGALVGWFGVHAAPATIVGCYLAMAAAAWIGLRADPTDGTAHTLRFSERFRLGARLLGQPRFALALAAAGLIQASHAFFYNFTAIVWRDQGIADLVIGLLIAFGVLAEIVLLFMLPRVEKRFEPAMLIAFGAVGGLIRWSCFAASPPLALLWPLQALHALSFAATHIGMMRLIQQETPEEISAFAQTLYAALAAGLFMGLAALAAGALHDAVGAFGYLAMAGLAALGLALISPLVLQKV
jgi:PPP family 3-phenylpropionic acid transporter